MRKILSLALPIVFMMSGVARSESHALPGTTHQLVVNGTIARDDGTSLPSGDLRDAYVSVSYVTAGGEFRFTKTQASIDAATGKYAATVDLDQLTASATEADQAHVLTVTVLPYYFVPRLLERGADGDGCIDLGPHVFGQWEYFVGKLPYDPLATVQTISGDIKVAGVPMRSRCTN